MSLNHFRLWLHTLKRLVTHGLVTIFINVVLKRVEKSRMMNEEKKLKLIATWVFLMKPRVSHCDVKHVNKLCIKHIIGVLSEAVSHFEQFYALSNGKEWYTQNGQNFETLASDCLCRIYTTIAEEVIISMEC